MLWCFEAIIKMTTYNDRMYMTHFFHFPQIADPGAAASSTPLMWPWAGSITHCASSLFIHPARDCNSKVEFQKLQVLHTRTHDNRQESCHFRSLSLWFTMLNHEIRHNWPTNGCMILKLGTTIAPTNWPYMEGLQTWKVKGQGHAVNSFSVYV